MDTQQLIKGPTFLQTGDEDSAQTLWVRMRIRIFAERLCKLVPYARYLFILGYATARLNNSYNLLLL